MQKLLCLAREEGGAELVEFALTSLVLVTLIFAFLNWMMGMYVFHFTTYAAQQATRFAMAVSYTHLHQGWGTGHLSGWTHLRGGTTFP